MKAPLKAHCREPEGDSEFPVVVRWKGWVTLGYRQQYCPKCPPRVECVRRRTGCENLDLFGSCSKYKPKFFLGLSFSHSAHGRLYTSLGMLAMPVWWTGCSASLTWFAFRGSFLRRNHNQRRHPFPGWHPAASVASSLCVPRDFLRS
jgi:hypothetical protein